jgi:hypothetical protein
MGGRLDGKPGGPPQNRSRNCTPVISRSQRSTGLVACAAMQQALWHRAAAEFNRGLRQPPKPSACLRSMRQQVRFLPGALPIQIEPGSRSQEADVTPFTYRRRPHRWDSSGLRDSSCLLWSCSVWAARHVWKSRADSREASPSHPRDGSALL